MLKVIPFSSDVNHIPFPKKIAYPFNYTPHPLAEIASKELQNYLTKNNVQHNFGIKNPNHKEALGKMFGVLVVKTADNKLGYLAAFSGKLANKNLHPYFVPPIFNILDENGFYRQTEKEIDTINLKIIQLEEDISYKTKKKQYAKAFKKQEKLLEEERLKIKLRRKKRKLTKTTNNQLNINEEFYLREYEVYLNAKIHPLKQTLSAYQEKIHHLKKLRKEKSANVQQEVFARYEFLNIEGKKANLLTIFKNSTQNIPAGAGDCCAPKLFQYAFLHQLTPIAMAEFWWGKPLNTSVRKHQHFYPACTGKCKPILTHMLQGMQVAENPLFQQLQTEKHIAIVFEDAHVLVINKPHNLLSVPGKEIKDAVYTRIKKQYPNATGPLLVHRLDMATSGILLIAKNKDIHQKLQAQFLNRTVKKRYVAILNGEVNNKKGTIELPLRVDLEDRPKQLVCFEHGKKAHTKWECLDIKNKKTRVYFYPITGRTHQLRVHAAHQKGLNTPIVGDDLYGTVHDRLYLHAESISFIHPVSLQEVSFSVPAPF